MAVRPKWAKDIMSLVFAAYYLIFAEQGDEVVRTLSVKRAQEQHCLSDPSYAVGAPSAVSRCCERHGRRLTIPM